MSTDALIYSLGYIQRPGSRSPTVLSKKNLIEAKNEFLRFIETNFIEDYTDFFKMLAKSDKFITIEDNFKNLNSTSIFLRYDGISGICYNVHINPINCVQQTIYKTPILKVFFDNTTVDYIFNLSVSSHHVLLINTDLKFSMTNNKFSLEPRRMYAFKLFPKQFISLNNDKNQCKERRSDPHYSQNFCHSNCLQHKLLYPARHCMKVGHFYVTENNKNFTMCNTFDMEEENVTMTPPDQLDSEIMNKCSTECIPFCDHYLYDITVSAVTMSKKEQNETSKPYSKIEFLYDVCNQGIMVIEEYELYTLDNLLADVGGYLGLWIGASAITFVQIIMCTIELLLIKFSKKKEYAITEKSEK